MGVWSDATDGYDENYDNLLPTTGGSGYAGVWHEQHVGGWTGPSGFYRQDWRAPVLEGQQKTWQPIYLWADASYTDPTMRLAIAPDVGLPPPGSWTYQVQLLAIPKDLTGAPPLGTTWTVPVDDTLYIEVPTFQAVDGLNGYQFAFIVTAAPEPASLALALAAACLARRRR